MGENILHGDEKQSYPQKNTKKCKKTVDNMDSTVGENVPHGKLSPTTISPRTVCPTNINNNTINRFNNNNINWDELSDEEKEYLLNWIDHMMKE